MSGGHFEYKDFYLNDVADKLRQTIARVRLDWEYYDFYSPEFLAECINVHDDARRLAARLHRLDWVLSCDDNEADYGARLAEDLADPTKYELDDPSRDEYWAGERNEWD